MEALVPSVPRELRWLQLLHIYQKRNSVRWDKELILSSLKSWAQTTYFHLQSKPAFDLK